MWRPGRCGSDGGVIVAVPLWVRALLAVAMLAVAAYHGRRLTAGAAHPAVDVAHAAMGVTMAAMLLQLPVLSGAWGAVVFAVPAVWFAVAGTRAFVLSGGPVLVPTVQPVVGCAAMAFMLTSLSGTGAGGHGGAMAMDGGAGSSGVLGTLAPLHPAALLVVALAALAIVTVIRRRPRTQSGWGACCQVGMSVTAIVMLTVA